MEEQKLLEPAEPDFWEVPVTDQKLTNAHWDVFFELSGMQASPPGVLHFFDRIPLFNLHLQMLLVVRPNHQYDKLLPQRQQKANHLLTRRGFGKTKTRISGSLASNVPKKGQLL